MSMDLRADLPMFFDVDEFAREFVHVATGTAFPAIFGVVDEFALDGYALTAEFQLCYPTEAVVLAEDDELQQADGDGVKSWRVRSVPERTGDGLQSMVLLSRNTAEPAGAGGQDPDDD